MQYLKITPDIKMTELSDLVGGRNTEYILRANNLSRTPNVGKAFQSLCDRIINSTPDVSWQRKQSILTTMVGDSDVFETAALCDVNSWKVLSTLGTFPNMLRIPETIVLPDTEAIMGDNRRVTNLIYSKVMECLLNEPHYINPEIFNDFDGAQTAKVVSPVEENSNLYQFFKIPWGEVSLYSSLAGTSVDFPVYPEEVSDKKSANYVDMPELLYQYEPWKVFQGNSARSNTYKFKFHRDMWTGDHRDGKANELVRFCEANLYARYSGSSVVTSQVKLYIGGKPIISGIVTDVNTVWSGPIGLDGFYLVCDLSLTITEISEVALNFDTVRNKSLIG